MDTWKGELWTCRCGTILAVITHDGRVWVAAEAAEWYRESLTYMRAPCPGCRRMNMRRLPERVVEGRMGAGGGHGAG